MCAEATTPRNRRTLLGLAALFLAPLLFAFWLYYGTGWRPAGSSNKSELIAPARQLPILQLPRLTPPAQAAAVVEFTGLWSLITISPGECNADCQKTLLYGRQVQQMLGRLSTRVQRVWLSTGACCDFTYLAREQADLQVADGTAAVGLLQTFPEMDRAYSIYVVDPLGNLMMRYDVRQDPYGLRDDLKKLLGLSHIG